MSVEVKYDREKEILSVAVPSPLTLDYFEEAMKVITRSDQFPPDIRTIWDVRKLDFSSIDLRFVGRLISIRKKYPERGSSRNAVIVADDLGFGVARMYAALGFLSAHVRVFRSYKAGEDWLLQP